MVEAEILGLVEIHQRTFGSIQRGYQQVSCNVDFMSAQREIRKIWHVIVIVATMMAFRSMFVILRVLVILVILMILVMLMVNPMKWLKRSTKLHIMSFMCIQYFIVHIQRKQKLDLLVRYKVFLKLGNFPWMTSDK